VIVLLRLSGYSAFKEAPWNDLSRGMHKAPDDQLDTDEGHMRCFWGKWSGLMEREQ